MTRWTLRRVELTYAVRAKIALLVGVVAAGSLIAPAGAAERMVVLGTDPELDAPPGADLTHIAVGRHGRDLMIEIGVANMVPVIGGLSLQGTQWTFEVRGRTFVAEGYPTNPGFGFTLFELVNGSYRQLENLQGTYGNDLITMLVPLKLIGARPGTRISGVGERGTEDVDVHFHLGVTDYIADTIATTRDYVVPR